MSLDFSALRTVVTGPRLGAVTTIVAFLLMLVFAAAVVLSRLGLREEIHRHLIERDAAVLYPVALQQLEESTASEPGREPSAGELLSAVLRSARMRDYLFAVTVFDAEGRVVRSLPENQLLPEIEPRDYPRLLGMERISRYHPEFPLDRYFAGLVGARGKESPVLEILLPLPTRDGSGLLGFAQYYIDGRPLAAELAAVDRGIRRQTLLILAAGCLLIALIMALAYRAQRRAQQEIAERNDRLAKANFELVLAAKASALGQITSHLLHGLQGPVAGLQAVVSGRAGSHSELQEEEAWRSAADYTQRLQSLIAEAVAMLGDSTLPAGYELTAAEMTSIIVSRNKRQAEERGLELVSEAEPALVLDSRRANLLCLIACNLLQNAFVVSPKGAEVKLRVGLSGGRVRMSVSDRGTGVPEPVLARLFEPGVSGRRGGSGLGLAISRLLARQLGGDLELVRNGPEGACFQVTLN